MKRLPTLLVVLVYILLLIGATVRTMGAGMACPDWPTCNGLWLLPFYDNPEQFHRHFAILVGIITLVLTIRIWTLQKFHSLRKLSLIAVLLLFAQAGLGAITVFQNNSPHTVAAHLLLGAIFFSVVIWIWNAILNLPQPLFVKEGSNASPFEKGGSRGILPSAPSAKVSVYRNHIYMSLVILFIQLGLGAMVSSSHAGLVCPDFPTCNGSWLPPMVGLVALQMMHRYMAYAVFLIVIGTFFVGRKVTVGTDRRLLKWALATVILQLLFGIGLIHAKIPHAMSVAHLGLAMLLWGLLTSLAYGTRRS